MFRELNQDEIELIAGGTDENDNPPPTEDDFTSPDEIDDGWDPDGDDDGDGIRNMDEEIVVTAAVTHDQIQVLNDAAYWYQWAQNVAVGLVVGGGLMTSTLTAGGQYGAGAAITGAASVPPLSDAQYQANWNILYYQMQLDILGENIPNKNLNPGLNIY
ncbi:MAG: hypothetical protein RLZZ407_1882 [Pseudomonadota bacterium]|jgi:hypothetical protein